ncbi:MAG: AMP-binding protein [Puniceicoccales bacterium]|jgi:acyl-CoA synthetase (AMP-forming)/AMP-acid ligase II|nr:AMP-binding protein [Puniceicoccales bacterium]
MSDNLTQSIKRYAKAMPTMDAIIEMKKTSRGQAVIHRRLSFEQLDRGIDQYAAKFSKEGIEPGSRVLMLLQPGSKMICAFFALIRIGAIPIIIDSGVGRKELVSLSNFSKPDFILCFPKIKWLINCRLLNIRGKIIAIGRFFTKSTTAAETMRDSDPEETVAILFTSGSTGRAKGVVYKYRNFASQLDKLRLTYHLLPNVKDVTFLPAFMLFNPIFGRVSIIPAMDFSRPATFHLPSVVETIVNLCATSSFGAPTLWKKITDYCLENGIKLRSLEQIFLAGVSATAQLIEDLQSIAPNAKIFTPYGATECLPICSISGEEILGEVRPLQENGAGTCLGFPVDDIEIRIIAVEEGVVDTLDESKILPLGFIGEIIVSGENVTESYDQLPQQTVLAKIHWEGKIWHRTGDLGFWDQKGRLWFCGRKTERVIDGKNEEYYPDCIEPLFHKYSAVERSALIKIEVNGKTRPAIAILPKKDQYPFFCWQKRAFRRKLQDLAQCFPKTTPIRDFFFFRKFPVDPRHNAKIHRLILGEKCSRRTLLDYFHR